MNSSKIELIQSHSNRIVQGDCSGVSTENPASQKTPQTGANWMAVTVLVLLLSSPFYRNRNQGMKNVSNLPKVTELVIDRGTFYTQEAGFRIQLLHYCVVCQGCHNKVPQMRWLQQQKLIFSQFWRLDNRDQNGSRTDFFRGLSPGLVDGHLLPVSSRALPSMCVSVIVEKGHPQLRL